MEAERKAIGSDTEPEVPAALTEETSGISHRAGIKPGIISNKVTKMWQNPRIAKLMSLLVNGNITCISPEIDLCLKDGFVYREADSILDTSGKETFLILDYIAREGFLTKQDFQKILVSPGGSVQLMPVERCPYCDSEQITRGRLIEHFNCGYIGLEEEFTSELKQVCPKCHRELKLIGTDYRKPGARYVCNRCHEIFASPTVKCRCVKTGEVYPLEELRHLVLYSYRLNEDHRKRLEFEFEPKRQLVSYLKRLGYHVAESGRVQGRSGATHTIDLLASIEDPITRHSVAIGILAALSSESDVSIDTLFTFDSKIYDTGIENKMIIAIPGLTSEAAKFAERQGIRVYSLDELRNLSSKQVTLAESSDTQDTAAPDSETAPDPAELGIRGWLKWLLVNKGYRVEEKYMLRGRSGADYTLDFYAQKDDGIMNHNIAACVIDSEDNQGNDVNSVIKFDSATYDAGIRDKVIISIPRLGKEARQFAKYQRIKILEAKDLADFSRQYLKDAPRINVTR